MISSQFVRRRAEDEVYIVVGGQYGEKRNAYGQDLVQRALPIGIMNGRSLGEFQQILPDISAQRLALEVYLIG